MTHRTASLTDNTAPHARGRADFTRRRFCLALGMAMMALGLGAIRSAAADPLPTVPAVDLGRYAGTWHEVARLPNWFQRSCVRSTARYIPNADGSMTVINTCSKANCRQTSIEGVATTVPCSGNARLRVKFGGLAALAPASREGNYWIIALDQENYQWAMVGTPDRRFLWILSRQPCLDPQIYACLKQQACRLGFDVGSLVRPGD